MRRTPSTAPSRWVAAAIASLALAACGSTVPLDKRAAAGQGSLVDGQLGGVSAPQSTSTGTSVDQVGSPTSPGTVAGGPATVDGSGTSVELPSVPTAVTANSVVSLGMTYSANADVFLKALGVSGSVADARMYGKALLDWVNANGGFAGHKVKPVYYNMDLTRTDPYSVWMQEMCSLWTEDNHVIAGMVAANSDFSPVAACLAKKGAVFDNPGAWVRTKADYRKYRNWFEPLILSAERLAVEYVSVPKQLGYFGQKPKIGLLVYDYPQSGQMAGMLTAELKRNGYDAPTTVVVHMGTSTPDLGSTLSQVQSAVLKFRAAGVDHVMSVAYPGAITFFMEYAQSQSYYPRYALVSYEGLTAVAANAPATELKDAVAVGWLPDGDVDSAHRPAINPTGKLCRKIFTAAGVAAADQPGGISYCDFVLMLKAGADRLTPASLSGPALVQALSSVASSFLSPATFGTTLSGTQHDGVDAVRGVRFDSGCSCWAYSGPIEAVR